MQPDVLQRDRAVMACRRRKSQEVRAATWNASSMVCRSGEVVDALHRRKIALCCAQKMRWKGGSARMLGVIDRRYKFFWQGCKKGLLILVFLLLRNVVRVIERIW